MILKNQKNTYKQSKTAVVHFHSNIILIKISLQPITHILGKDTSLQQGFLHGVRNGADSELVIYGCACHDSGKDWKSDACQLQQIITTGMMKIV